MSELIQLQNARRDLRWSLLTTVSSLALGVVACLPAHAANDADRPTIWIELGAQLERVQGGEEPFQPPFLHSNPRPGFEAVPSSSTQRPPRYSFGGDGKVTFDPKGSDWSLVAAVRYGRSNSDKHLHEQTTEVRQSGKLLMNDDPFYVHLTRFGDTVSTHKEGHLVADFMAGRDVGLGLWRGSSSATVDFGVRFAQFTATSTTTLMELPDPFIVRVPQPPTMFRPSWHKYKTHYNHHSFYGHNSVSRSFSGIGPTLSMSGSQSLVGNTDDGQISFDWGANVAVLFGRQKVRGSHRTTGSYIDNQFSMYAPKSRYDTGKQSINRTRSVVVPNLGGSAGVSVRYSNTRFSLGYRADFFFGAMDGGIDMRDTRNRDFYGPFATISIGLGGAR